MSTEINNLHEWGLPRAAKSASALVIRIAAEVVGEPETRNSLLVGSTWQQKEVTAILVEITKGFDEIDAEIKIFQSRCCLALGCFETISKNFPKQFLDYLRFYFQRKGVEECHRLTAHAAVE